MDRENNYAFIDSQNLNLAIRDQGWVLDPARFRTYLKDKYNINKAFLFLGYIPNNRSMYAALEKSGYNIVFKPVVIHTKGTEQIIKGNVDAELVLHTMIQLPNYRKAVIVSGDGDFYCLVGYLLKIGKLERLLVPNRFKYSALLREFILKTDYMNELAPKLQLDKPKTAGRRLW